MLHTGALWPFWMTRATTIDLVRDVSTMRPILIFTAAPLLCYPYLTYIYAMIVCNFLDINCIVIGLCVD